MLKTIPIALLLQLVTVISWSQTPTIGLIYPGQNVSSGYVLFTPENSTSSFLIDECGGMVHSWSFSEKPGLTCYLLNNGNLLRAGKDSLEIVDWDNNLIWSYAISANGINQHHDIEPLPNGNILCVAWDIYPEAAVLAMGGDSTLSVNGRNFERVVELQPVGSNQANIVWEWKFVDHLIQEYDPTKPNFGSVQAHPELLNMNFDNGETDDYVHLNAIDYNPDLDQIMVTARHLNELIIIDHSTSTLEAAGHTGGNSGKGGDFLWRWGNPQMYNSGTGGDKVLILPHDGKWVESGYADEGKISVFNNRGDGFYTTSFIHLIEPSIVGGQYEMGTFTFLPYQFDWSWSDDILGTTFYENKKCGTHALPNGNMMLCETGRGRISEIAKNGDVIWSYINPVGATVNTQYSSSSAVQNFIFRAEKYTPDFPGFVGKNLTSNGTIENENNLTDSCYAYLSLDELHLNQLIFGQPAENGNILFFGKERFDLIEIFDVQGKLIFTETNFEGSSLQTNLPRGMYYLITNESGKIGSHRLVNL